MSVTGDDILEKIVTDDVMSSDFIYLKYDADEKILPHNEEPEEEEITEQSNVFNENESLQQVTSDKENQIFETVSAVTEEVPNAHVQQFTIKMDNVKKELIESIERSKEEQMLAECMMTPHPKTITAESTDANDDDDEETIAIFATAAGQELALYRVDGSDEIYAVSSFDDSGNPPTNFQYLMSSEVERLIKQGAVRTVKKPLGLKSQLVATESITPATLSPAKEPLRKPIRIEPKFKDTRQYKPAWESANRNKLNKNVSSTVYSDLNKEPDVNYVMVESLEQDDDLEDLYSDEEVLQQSTVQYLLCDDEQSDSELTFDDIKNLGNKKNVTKSTPKIVKKKPEQSTNGMIPTKPPPMQRLSVRPNIMQTHRRSVKNNISDAKPNYLKGNAVFVVEDFVDPGKENTTNVKSTPEKQEMKVKRPRKQKLTSVNRGDSEIIIQPASMIEEEEETPIRKRNRRKRKSLPDPDYNPRTPTRKMRKLRKNSRVEVIDIDLDEEDNEDTIEEITLDDGKEKNSSDKENNVIMVGDSDAESQASDDKHTSPVLKCQYCSRNFRQRRLLDTHTRICQKELSKKTGKPSTGKREFKCKSCDEKFDAALTLARHVRANHPPKRGRPRKIIHGAGDEDDDDSDFFVKSITPDKVTEKLTKKILPRETRSTKITRSSLKDDNDTGGMVLRAKPRMKKFDDDEEIEKVEKKTMKKMNPKKYLGVFVCRHCVKVSLNLKEARFHMLQHVTKSALNYCKKCKAVAPSKSVLLQHMKTHEKKKPEKPVAPSKVEAKPKEEPPVAPRKRGRPRKNKPAD